MECKYLCSQSQFEVANVRELVNLRQMLRPAMSGVCAGASARDFLRQNTWIPIQNQRQETFSPLDENKSQGPSDAVWSELHDVVKR